MSLSSRACSSGPLLLVLAVGCALPAREVDDVLGAERGANPEATESGSRSAGEPSLEQVGSERQARADEHAAHARLAAEPAGASASALIEGSRALFSAADLRIQRATVRAFAQRPPREMSDLLGAEDHLSEELRAEVLALCEVGLEYARRARGLDANDVAAAQYEALHLALIASAKGPARSLFEGLGPRLARAIQDARALDESYDHYAPIRLDGRFRARAPWPYGDPGEARRLLERAARAAPLPIHHLYLGDVLYAAGDAAGAIEQWRLALVATPDETTRATAPFQRELARQRIEFSELEPR